MKVYHTSQTTVTSPDTQHSREFLDFGKGFYVTTLREQAVKYAERFLLRGREAWLNTYELKDTAGRCAVKTFAAYDAEWLDFVATCRKGTDATAFDVVIGGIANDKVFRTIDLYFSGDIGKDEALRRLKFEKPNNQICIRSQQVLDECLTFLSSQQL